MENILSKSMSSGPGDVLNVTVSRQMLIYRGYRTTEYSELMRLFATMSIVSFALRAYACLIMCGSCIYFCVMTSYHIILEIVLCFKCLV
uniref:Uncharacterized protein n=1 Tax=Oryza punctata TaxID=4537 RepID=A0A0E0MDK7_ORYPU